MIATCGTVDPIEATSVAATRRRVTRAPSLLQTDHHPLCRSAALADASPLRPPEHSARRSTPTGTHRRVRGWWSPRLRPRRCASSSLRPHGPGGALLHRPLQRRLLHVAVGHRGLELSDLQLNLSRRPPRTRTRGHEDAAPSRRRAIPRWSPRAPRTGPRVSPPSTCPPKTRARPASSPRGFDARADPAARNPPPRGPSIRRS